MPGAQLAVRYSGRLTVVEAGERVAGSGLPITADTAFPIASLTKPVTALAVQLLQPTGASTSMPRSARTCPSSPPRARWAG
ncbi:serine hydrolase [Streptomyces apocyni]|uniref:serine hydrolase n=1 Tax=Streptomyces apocyni TaxID=2654677 RepID=UPI0018D05909|nr:serine hydrolase domain-containing protein [Streptomyces apocyni]